MPLINTKTNQCLSPGQEEVIGNKETLKNQELHRTFHRCILQLYKNLPDY